MSYVVLLKGTVKSSRGCTLEGNKSAYLRILGINNSVFFKGQSYSKLFTADYSAIGLVGSDLGHAQ